MAENNNRVNQDKKKQLTTVFVAPHRRAILVLLTINIIVLGILSIWGLANPDTVGSNYTQLDMSDGGMTMIFRVLSAILLAFVIIMVMAVHWLVGTKPKFISVSQLYMSALVALVSLLYASIFMQNAFVGLLLMTTIIYWFVLYFSARTLKSQLKNVDQQNLAVAVGNYTVKTTENFENIDQKRKEARLQWRSLSLHLNTNALKTLSASAIKTKKSANEYQQTMQDRLQSFALDNNLTFMTEDSDPHTVDKGNLFKHGFFRKKYNFINGNFFDLPFSLYTYQYKLHRSRVAKPIETTVMEIKLPRRLPHMVIDSIYANSFGRRSILPIKFSKKSRFQLSGDFGRLFDLYAPDEYGVTALTILAPDAMSALIDHAYMCDIEIIDDRLYFYWNYNEYDEDFIRGVFQSVVEVLNKIGPELTAKNVFANPTQAYLHSKPNMSARLDRQTTPLLASSVIGVLLALYFTFGESFSFDQFVDYSLYFVSGIFIVYMIVSAILSRIHHQWKKYGVIRDIRPRR